MKLTTATFLTALGLLGGGCATTSGQSFAARAPGSTHGQLSPSASASPTRGTMGGMEMATREPSNTSPPDRGIPMPEPARDPSLRAVPTPQVPIPFEPQRSSFSSGSVRGYVY